jgi:hypothetical protein
MSPHYTPIPRLAYSLHVLRALTQGFAPAPTYRAFLCLRQRALSSY